MKVNNWAILVASSRYWFNYRHVANILSIYQSVKNFGIPDDRIIVMVPDSSCDPRNPYPGKIYNSHDNIEDNINVNSVVDYGGDSVSTSSFVNLLTGRHENFESAANQLNTDENSRILMFMTGHGGNGFFKFQDFEEISAEEIGAAFVEMDKLKRYGEILIFFDTCQAATLTKNIVSPNIIAISSSAEGENSYAYQINPHLQVATADRFTYSLTHLLAAHTRKIRPDKFGNQKFELQPLSIGQLMTSFQPSFLLSTPTLFTSAVMDRPLDQVLLNDFFTETPPDIELFQELASIKCGSHDVDDASRFKKWMMPTLAIASDAYAYESEIITNTWSSFKKRSRNPILVPSMLIFILYAVIIFFS